MSWVQNRLAQSTQMNMRASSKIPHKVWLINTWYSCV